MLGKPKFKCGDIVKFKFDDKTKEGIIAIVDAYGTFEQSKEVSYDILVKSENTLYKHYVESDDMEKVGETDSPFGLFK